MDDRETKVLIEIRDLMRQQVANSNIALERQGEALKRQGDAIARTRKGQKVIAILVSILLAVYTLSVIFPWAMIGAAWLGRR